ncbi:hypothetical protein [Adlercreutzia sp. ZJ473]|uniref:hypothetical protein n=1 Tax=Adlercreutzia sp. ZJ473 TaxID=2722822 RepID=UPI001553578C|nr:hypothetical protein [Adlercreutzia sp. ZJ473]
MSESSSTAMTQDERDEALTGAVSYCLEKYGVEVEPAAGEGLEGGVPAEGSTWDKASFSGVPVIVSCAGETFAVDVVDGVGAGDSRQSAQVEEALVDHLVTSAGLPKPLDGQLTSCPVTWGALFDGANIEQLCAEAEDMSCTLVFDEAPAGLAKLPEGFDEAWCLTVADMPSWERALANDRSASWAFQPECCLPYLASCLHATRGEEGVACAELPLSEGSGFCFWGSERMGVLFDRLDEGAGEKLQPYDSCVTFGDAYACLADAPAFAETGDVMVFVPSERWGELTRGYSDVGYSVRQLTGATFKMGRNFVSGPLAANGNVDEFGDYHVLYVPPESELMLYGAPVG